MKSKEELQGAYDELGTAPIVVWERENGRLEIITGRHRLDPICKSHKHKYFQIVFCKLEIQITSCSEDTHDLVWKYLETEKEYRCNYCTGSSKITPILTYFINCAFNMVYGIRCSLFCREINSGNS